MTKDFTTFEESLVDSDHALEALLQRLESEGQKICAVDTEADSLHSYREKLCLIQMQCGKVLSVIDPLKISHESLLDLVRFWEHRIVWFHGADFDMTLLQRTFGIVPDSILDTQIAARLIGHDKFGLANLIEAYFGVQLSKASQKADWGARPIVPKMLAYAYDDVRYLLALAGELMARLDDLGRITWFEEWCRQARVSVLNRKERSPDEVWRISGWGKLDRKGLAYLREIWLWRDEESEMLDRPPFKVLNNQQMMDLAQRAASGQEVRGSRGLRPDQSQRFREALERARKLDPADYPLRRVGKGAPRADINLEAYEKLRKLRDAAAQRCDLDPTIIATRSALETLANDPGKAEELLMTWQRELIFA